MEKKLLTNGNTFKRTDGRWCGVVWYMDESGEHKRRSFSGKTKTAVQEKITKYISDFDKLVEEKDESKKTLFVSMQNWLEVFKYPMVENTTYDRLECTARHHAYPELGNRIVSTIIAADIKKILNDRMERGYAYTTVKKIHDLFGEYFRYMVEQEFLPKNPMLSVPMTKKANFMAAQGKECKPTSEEITVFTEEELQAFKAECFRTFKDGKRMYQQAAAYMFMVNTGLRPGEMLGLLNSDIDLEKRIVHVRRGVKEVSKREGTQAVKGRVIKVGKLKTASSKRDVPLNKAAIAMVEDLRKEFYFGEDTPLVCDEHGEFTKPVNFRKRFLRILKAAHLPEYLSLHSFRHTYATRLGNGVKQPDGTILRLSPKQIANLLGHTTSEITELYYIRNDPTALEGITDGFDV